MRLVLTQNSKRKTLNSKLLNVADLESIELREDRK
jgi:hypothetical protein